MKNIELTIKDRGGSNSTSFSGRREGRNARKVYQLDAKDEDKVSYSIHIPEDTTSMNPSFFLGMFYLSVKKLGLEKFRSKYKFDLSNLKPGLEPIIKRNIEECLVRAVREMSGRTGLDSLIR